jgi:alpha-tubulin suppressor-like RCC1 family protein
MEDGTILSVGSGAVGQLGHGDNKDLSRPKLLMMHTSPPQSFRHVKQIAAGQHHSIALMSDGTVATFGKRRLQAPTLICEFYVVYDTFAIIGLAIYGQLGLTLTAGQTYVNIPTLLPNIGSIKKVEGGSLYTFLYTETDFSSGQILMKFGLYPNFQIANSFPQVTADTSYSNSMTQET